MIDDWKIHFKWAEPIVMLSVIDTLEKLIKADPSLRRKMAIQVAEWKRERSMERRIKRITRKMRLE